MRARGGRAVPLRRHEAENAAVGEFDLLARLRERLPPPAGHLLLGAGDDAAISVPGGATAPSAPPPAPPPRDPPSGASGRRRLRSGTRRWPPRSPTSPPWAPLRVRPTWYSGF